MGIDKVSMGIGKVAMGIDKVSMGIGKVAMGIDKRSKGIGKVAMGIDKRSKGIGKVAMGTAILLSSKEIPNANFELICKKCNTTRKVDSINGKVKIEKSGSKYVLASQRRRYHCPGCGGDVTAKSIKKL
jgi:hypothetical protein